MTLFNMATGIQIKFHQDIITHLLMTIINVTSKRSAVLHYLKKKVKQYIQYDCDMIQSLMPDCSRFLVFHFSTSQALVHERLVSNV